jgi:Tfp pilus assembly protein PilW
MKSTRTSGFTLIEVLIALTIGMIILGVALSLTLSNRQLLTRDRTSNELNQNLQAAAEIMGDDIRLAGADLGAPIPSRMPIVIANNYISISRDLSPNPNNINIETRIYQLDTATNTLTLTVTTTAGGNQAAAGVINNVSAMNVTAILQGTTTVTTLGSPTDPNVDRSNWSNITSIQVGLTGTATINGHPVTKTLTSTFFPRNVFSK